MNDLRVVKSAKYISGHTLEITFDDGLRAQIDFTLWIEKYPIFEPLKDVDYFKGFTLDGWTVAWENGADIAPETLYKIASTKLPQLV